MAKFNCSRYRHILFLCAVLIFCAGTATASDSKTKTPMETIKASNEAILAIYSSSAEIDDNALQRIFAVMDGVTDFATIGERALGTVCPEFDNELCSKLRNEFVETLRFTATGKLGRYRAERFEYLAEEVTAGTGYVKTMAHYKEDSVKLDYVLENRDGNWRIVNYIVDDVDTIRNHQRQFSRIVGKETLSGLLARLQAKNEQYRNERGAVD